MVVVDYEWYYGGVVDEGGVVVWVVGGEDLMMICCELIEGLWVSYFEDDLIGLILFVIKVGYDWIVVVVDVFVIDEVSGEFFGLVGDVVDFDDMLIV